MITLTKRLDNNPLYLNANLIAGVTSQLVRNEKANIVETIIFIHGMAFHVVEKVDVVLSMIQQAKSK